MENAVGGKEGEMGNTNKVDHASRGELRLNGSRHVDGGSAVDHAEFLLAVFDHVELDGDDARDFDGAAEGDFAVALCQQTSALFTKIEGERMK